MTFSECIPHLIQGKKIRKPNWHEKSYLAFDFSDKFKPLCEFNTFKDGSIRKYNYIIHLDDITYRLWEVAQEKI
jgi:hypothetical protein